MKNIYFSTLFCIFICIAVIRIVQPIFIDQVSQWDEATNIQVVRETSRRLNPFALQYNERPFFEKPPVWYIGTSLSIIALGDNTWTYRIISAISGILLVSILLYMAKKYYGIITCIFTGVLFLTTHQLFIKNIASTFSTHTLWSADSDSLFILLLFLSWYFSLKASTDKIGGYGMAITASLAILTKGPLGLLPIFIWTLNRLINHSFLSSNGRNILIVVCLLPITWYVGMIIIYGNQFLQSHIIYHLFARIIFPLESHSKPLYFPASLLFNTRYSLYIYTIPFLIWFIVRYKTWISDYKVSSVFFMTLGIVTITTVTQTKLSWYILPIYPFLALLTGYALDSCIQILYIKFRYIMTMNRTL